MARTKFPSTFVVEPDSTNGLKERGVALVFHVRYLDSDFLGDRIGKLGAADIEKMDALLADLLKLR